jgi:hypothetical protein
MKFIILYCRRDQVWLVARKSTRKPYLYTTQAECFTEEAAELLYKELIKKK